MNNDELLLTMATKLRELSEEVNFLRKFIYLDGAASLAVQEYVAKLAPDPKAAKRELAQLIRTKYDERISGMEAIDPAYAARIDMRSELDEKDQSRWYFPSTPDE